ncbi:MAG: transposase [Planctomycetaceae bacterium]|nr:transposase [Planctomycetaceae bacterium]
MGREKRRYDCEFKASVAFEAIRGRESVEDLSKRYGLHPSLIHAWRKRVLDSAPQLMAKAGLSGADAEALREKEREVERLSAENRWLQLVVQRMTVEQRRDAVEMENPTIPVLRQVKLLNINRSGIYYRLKRRASLTEESRQPMAASAMEA